MQRIVALARLRDGLWRRATASAVLLVAALPPMSPPLPARASDPPVLNTYVVTLEAEGGPTELTPETLRQAADDLADQLKPVMARYSFVVRAAKNADEAKAICDAGGSRGCDLIVITERMGDRPYRRQIAFRIQAYRYAPPVAEHHPVRTIPCDAPGELALAAWQGCPYDVLPQFAAWFPQGELTYHLRK